MSKGITPREENYSAWYNEIILKAGLAEHSEVKGCMVIKPYGFAIWEKMKDKLDSMFKETGHVNAYFPLFIPKSFMSREAEHVEGFAKECAVVTHHRLKVDPEGNGLIVDPDAKLEEELIVRPTSETIIWNTYRNWITSYRDLPLLINQWANVVRWEMRTRLFLRTTEFLWQEGHTAHATKDEAIAEARQMLDVYATFAEETMAMPVIKGVKSESERFAGADDTYTIEALMQDGKALQAGTSHFLGQNFAKAFEVQFSNENNESEYVWATSWGVSTRLIGGLIMTHSDDHGLVLPPALAPLQVVIVPIPKGDEKIDAIAADIIAQLKKQGITAKYDNDERQRPGFKFAEYEMKGVPIRIGIGQRDLANNEVEVARRDTFEKKQVNVDSLSTEIPALLDQIQQNLYQRALAFRESNIHEVSNKEEFKAALEKGGFIKAYWDGTAETEEQIKQETKATIRCIPLSFAPSEGKCFYTGKLSNQQVLFAIAY
jgi:prolyl-tRNA synthetase